MCLNLACRWLGVRPQGQPAPTHCPRCGSELPVVDPATGRWPAVPVRAGALVAAVRAELRQPCRHGVPRDQPCATCSEEVPF